MLHFKMTAHDLKVIPRLSCRVSDQSYMNRKLKRDKKTGVRLLAHLAKLTIKHWLK